MKILIVEDDKYIAQLYTNLFNLEGFTATSNSSAKEALESLESSQELPDMILLDIMMPEMDGFQFLEKKNEDPKLKPIPVIVLTNMYDDEARDKAKSFGALDLFVKSELNPKDLVEKVKEILG